MGGFPKARKKSLMERGLSFLKTVQFNYRVFPPEVARKLPVWVHYRVKVDSVEKGCIQIDAEEITKAMIRLGCNNGSPEILNWAYAKKKNDGYIRIGPGSKLIFRGKANVAKGFSLVADCGGTIDIGADFYANLNFFAEANRFVKIGRDCMLGWNVFIRDVDGHPVYARSDPAKQVLNAPKGIEIGQHVWLGAETSVLKGAKIPDHSVVAYGALVTGRQFQQKHTIIGGIPASVIKSDIEWAL